MHPLMTQYGGQLDQILNTLLYILHRLGIVCRVGTDLGRPAIYIQAFLGHHKHSPPASHREKLARSPVEMAISLL